MITDENYYPTITTPSPSLNIEGSPEKALRNKAKKQKVV